MSHLPDHVRAFSVTHCPYSVFLAGQHLQVTPPLAVSSLYPRRYWKGVTGMQSGARDTGAEVPQDAAARKGRAKRYIDDNLPPLPRGRAAVGAWRRDNPGGLDEQLVEELGPYFAPDWGPVLRGMLFRYDLDHGTNLVFARARP
jgi:hypothetical protein